jgi:hypothetical protein
MIVDAVGEVTILAAAGVDGDVLEVHRSSDKGDGVAGLMEGDGGLGRGRHVSLLYHSTRDLK